MFFILFERSLIAPEESPKKHLSQNISHAIAKYYIQYFGEMLVWLFLWHLSTLCLHFITSQKLANPVYNTCQPSSIYTAEWLVDNHIVQYINCYSKVELMLAEFYERRHIFSQNYITIWKKQTVNLNNIKVWETYIHSCVVPELEENRMILTKFQELNTIVRKNLVLCPAVFIYSDFRVGMEHEYRFKIFFWLERSSSIKYTFIYVVLQSEVQVFWKILGVQMNLRLFLQYMGSKTRQI